MCWELLKFGEDWEYVRMRPGVVVWMWFDFGGGGSGRVARWFLVEPLVPKKEESGGK